MSSPIVPFIKRSGCKVAKECQLLVVSRHPACVAMDTFIDFVSVSEEKRQFAACFF